MKTQSCCKRQTLLSGLFVPVEDCHGFRCLGGGRGWPLEGAVGRTKIISEGGTDARNSLYPRHHHYRQSA